MITDQAEFFLILPEFILLIRPGSQKYSGNPIKNPRMTNKKTQNHIYKEEDIIKPEEGLSYQVRKNEVVY